MMVTRFDVYQQVEESPWTTEMIKGQEALAHSAFAFGLAGADPNKSWGQMILLGRDATAGLDREDAEAFFRWNFAAGERAARKMK